MSKIIFLTLVFIIVASSFLIFCAAGEYHQQQQYQQKKPSSKNQSQKAPLDDTSNSNLKKKSDKDVYHCAHDRFAPKVSLKATRQDYGEKFDLLWGRGKYEAEKISKRSKEEQHEIASQVYEPIRILFDTTFVLNDVDQRTCYNVSMVIPTSTRKKLTGRKGKVNHQKKKKQYQIGYPSSSSVLCDGVTITT